MAALALDPDRVGRPKLFHHTDSNRLYRLWADGRPLVLKVIGDSEAIEVRAYDLLTNTGVPTLPVRRRTGRALLLDDLKHDDTWRLATEHDVGRPDVGTAVARWYRAFHNAGSRYLESHPRPGWLTPEWHALDADLIKETARQLNLEHLPVWELAAFSIDDLKEAMLSFSQTFNYNDFHWTNLALSRSEEPIVAVVFDFGLLGIGPRYSDVRNVTSSLAGAAVQAFRDTYGPTDEREAILDAPTADLYGLYEAARRERVPSWAYPPIVRAESGELERRIREAVAVF